ncbi:enoyl-CoA hydratase [Rhodopirellula bahusiensis]|uniref:Enoyl-CoA hydratase domain-containing protein 3, mitochondrial n=1 Tax=Rhodopirellula bahusiensis TaxID=2014065 RepID=A0A2G1W9Q1_9BACT|nr:enoyl-CoA hydratase [Rhodopirellula bahusiensis]PHQ35748.1 enoyl-CoA hydratase [Rhodopirellula bahusiensis]
MEPTTESELLVKIDEGIATATLNRAAKRNALSLELLASLESELNSIADNPDVRVVVLQAAGPVFSSGHDLKQMIDRSADEYSALFTQCAATMQRLRTIPQPVIAQVQGLATAAGCQLVASCDLAIASENAWFATPGVKIGLFCTTPMVPLVRSLPPKIAMEMLLTGDPLSAQRAYDLGFINRVVSIEELEAATLEMARKIASASRETIAIGKQAFYQQASLSESEAYGQAVEVMTQNSLHGDAQEGIQAFLEKRTPVWNQ